jgi:T5SS/PEP-CTERM-associated repeat protein
MKRSINAVAAAVAAVSFASAAGAQTAYFSLQGDFTANSSLQDFFVTTSRSITSSETLRFETFSSRGTTPNAAGDTSPTIAHNFDSNLTLTNTFSSGTFSNDDGAPGASLDSLLSWNGIADSAGNLGTSLPSSLYRLRLNEFDNLTGPWGVDLVGPANGMTFGGFASAGGTSVTRSLKFGTDGAADLNAPATAHARFLHGTSDAYTVTGDFVVGQTGNASYVGSSTAGGRITVGGQTLVKRGGDITLSGNHVVNANGTFVVDGGRVALSGTSRINVAGTLGSSFADLTNGARMDVNAGTTFDAPNVRLDLGFASNATENLLVVVDGTVNSSGGSIAESAGSRGRATINGANGRWNMTNDLFVGKAGNGTLEVTTGAKVSNRNAFVGNAAGGSGTAFITGTGSVWTNTGNLTLGRAAGGSTGTLTIDTGSRLNVGDTAAAIPLDDYNYIDDSSANATDGGTLFVYSGSTLTINNTGISIGRVVGHSGRIVVAGTGATVNAGTYNNIGDAGNGFVDISAGGHYTSEYISLGYSLDSRGTVTVDGAGSQLRATADLNLSFDDGISGVGTITTTNGGYVSVGDDSSSFVPGGGGIVPLIVSDASPESAHAGGVLTIANGSTLIHSGGGIIGFNGGKFGTARVTGNGSLFSLANLNVAEAGNGLLDIIAGGRVTTSGGVTMATEGAGGAVGTINVNGANSTLAVGTSLEIGSIGTGTVNIQSGGKVTAANAVVGIGSQFGGGSPSGTVNLTGIGSLFNVSGNLTLGRAAGGSTGNLTISSGARLNVGDGAPTFPPDDYNYIDDSSANASDGGTLFVYGGSTLTNNNTGFSVGEATGHSGRIVVSGAGATFNAGLFSLIGNNGTGIVNISAGGTYTTNNDTYLGFSTGTGTVTVDGAGSLLWSKGNLSLKNGSTITTTNGGKLLVGDAAGVVDFDVIVADGDPIGSNGGVLTISNGSTLTSVDGIVGAFNSPGAPKSGRVVVTGTNSLWSNTGEVDVGYNGTGELNIQAGGRVISANTFAGSFGGNGSINISTGGRLETTSGVLIADNTGATTATATVTGSNSTLAVGTTLEVGRGGTGTLNVQSAGKVTATNAVVGSVATGVGVVNVTGTGSILDVSGLIAIGGDGTNARGTGRATAASGGLIRATGNVIVYESTGSELVVNGGSVTAASAIVRGSGAARGTLRGVGTVTGTLSVTGGRVAPGDVAAVATPAAGVLNVTGAATFSATSRLDIDLASATSADRLAATGTVSAGGTLLVNLLNGFKPARADVFTILTGSAVSGTFSNLNTFGLISSADNGWAFVPTYAATNVLLRQGVQRGDVNLDGLVTNQDIAPFVAALTGATPTGQTAFAVDCNRDGVITNQDIAPFVSLLTSNTGITPGQVLGLMGLVPEPASLSLLGVAGIALSRGRRRR